MKPDVRFLSLTECMLNQSVDLFIEVFSQEPWNDVYESRAQVVAFFENYMRDNYFLGYVLMDKEAIIALSMGAKKPWIKGMEYYIDQFCVREKYQGAGVGSEFLRLIEQDVKCKGMNAIVLTTEKGFPSEKFYLKNGFSKLEELVCLAK